MREVMENVKVVGASDISVLVLGESGTGKELIAQSIHRLSARRSRPFVPINCAALPANLIESELFGHYRRCR
jgi:two-component system response regulator HydG